MNEIKALSLVHTNGVLNEVFFQSFGETETDFGAADFAQQAWYGGALVAVTELMKLASAEDASLARVLEKLGMLEAEIRHFSELRAAAATSPHVDTTPQ